MRIPLVEPVLLPPPIDRSIVVVVVVVMLTPAIGVSFFDSHELFENRVHIRNYQYQYYMKI